MQNPYGEEQQFNRFLLASIVLHAIVFLTFPQWSSLFVSDTPGMGDGGVIRIMSLESSRSQMLSPVTDRLSQTTRPRVTEPRPIPEVEPQPQATAQPEPAQVEESVTAQPQPVEESTSQAPDIPVEPEPPEPITPEPRPEPVTPEPELEPEPIVEEPVQEVQTSAGEILTSESGPEAIIDNERNAVEPPPELRPEPEPLPEQEPGASGSGSGTQGEADAAGKIESGEGEADTAPPPPPPPPSGSSLHLGGGSPMYPKNASHVGVEGTVKLSAAVSASGNVLSVVVAESSGVRDLDLQALRTVEAGWTFRSADYDYVIEIVIHFGRENGEFTTSYEYGDVTWINVE